LDYYEWEKQVKQQREENRKLLQNFSDWLSAKGLSEKTINKHVTNIDFYINEFLLYEDVKTPAEGIIEIDKFLGYWFIRKAMWATRTSINDYCAGFKKFYKFMLEKEIVTKDDYQEMLEEIKENREEWLATLQRFDDPEDIWGI
jgi:site-specific recombinase XerD